MNEEYWKALIKGLTPDSREEADAWWMFPLLVLLVACLGFLL